MAEKYELDPVTGKYPDLYETNMPEAPDDFDNLLDMTADLQGYWDQYLTYKKAGNTVAANQVLVAHPKLKQCFWNAEKANQIIHGLLATQRTIHDNLDVWLNKKVNNEIWIHNIPILLGSWTSQSDGTYTYRYSREDITQNGIPQVIWTLESKRIAMRAVITPVSYDGYIDFIAEKRPSGDMTIESLIIHNE